MRDDHDPRNAAPPDLHLLGRYLEGRVSPAEAAVVDRWVAADERRREALEALRWVWHTEGHATRPLFDSRAEWARLPRWVRAGLAPVGAGVPPRAARRWLPQLGVAAALVLAAGAGLWVARRGDRAAVAPVTDVAYVTGRGQLRTVTLDDGTRVSLGAASRLIAPRTFAAERSVTVEGEAYFDVVHDSTRPFRVRASGMTVGVLGTRFSVRAFPGSAAREVAVRSGRVAVALAAASRAREPTVLTGGMILRGAGDGGVVERIDTTAYFGWTRGELVFDNRPLHEVLDAVERWYDLTIVLDDTTLAHGRVTATFGRQSKAEVARWLAGAVRARVEQRGDTTFFRRIPAGRATPRPTR